MTSASRRYARPGQHRRRPPRPSPLVHRASAVKGSLPARRPDWTETTKTPARRPIAPPYTCSRTYNFPLVTEGHPVGDESPDGRLDHPRRLISSSPASGRVSPVPDAKNWLLRYLRLIKA